MTRICFGLALVFTSSAFSAERMGSFEFSEVFLNPVLEFQGPESGGFELRQSHLGFQWSKGDRFHAVIKLGNSDLLAPAIWFDPSTQPEFGLTELYMEGLSESGDVRVGLINVGFGFESLFPQWNALLPESQTRQRGWLIKRDYGLSLSWRTSPWETTLAVHNGESRESRDGRFWATGSWMYRAPGPFRFVLGGQVGSTQPQATSLSTAPAAGFVYDPLESAKIRQGSVALVMEWSSSLMLIEGFQGQILQNDLKHSFVAGRFDAILNLGGDLGLLLRHEQGNPHQGTLSTETKAQTAGFVLHSRDQLYSVSVYGTHLQEEPAVDNSIYGVQFRIRSLLF